MAGFHPKGGAPCRWPRPRGESYRQRRRESGRREKRQRSRARFPARLTAALLCRTPHPRGESFSRSSPKPEFDRRGKVIRKTRGPCRRQDAEPPCPCLSASNGSSHLPHPNKDCRLGEKKPPIVPCRAVL